MQEKICCKYWPGFACQSVVQGVTGLEDGDMLRFADLAMDHRMEAIGEIIMEKGYPTILCLQASPLPPGKPSAACMILNCWMVLNVLRRHVLCHHASCPGSPC